MRTYLVSGSIAAAAAAFVFLYVWWPGVPAANAPVVAPALATTSAAAPIETAPPATTGAPPPLSSTDNAVFSRKEQPSKTSSSTPVTQAPTSTPSAAAVQDSLAQGATALRAALVNIICTTTAGGGIRSISGSGVIVSAKGVILTNAHIGQYFLLTNYPSPDSTDCVVRTGSPATPAYKAKLIFISPTWIHDNPNTLTEIAPTGTGEHDIALLAITKSDTGAPLPTSFPSVSLATRVPFLGEPVVIESYAAQFLSASEIESSLYPTIVYGTIKNVYTFATTTVDVVSLGGTAAAQEGSSGGGILDSAGKLISTITTSTVKGATSSRTLYAITASYIRRDYAAETSRSLNDLLAESTSTAVADFAPTRSTLTTFLLHALSGQ